MGGRYSLLSGHVCGRADLCLQCCHLPQRALTDCAERTEGTLKTVKREGKRAIMLHAHISSTQTRHAEFTADPP